MEKSKWQTDHWFNPWTQRQPKSVFSSSSSSPSSSLLRCRGNGFLQQQITTITEIIEISLPMFGWRECRKWRFFTIWRVVWDSVPILMGQRRFLGTTHGQCEFVTRQYHHRDTTPLRNGQCLCTYPGNHVFLSIQGLLLRFYVHNEKMTW